MHAAEFQLLSGGQLELLAVQFLPGAGIWDEPCQPVKFRHDRRAPFAHGGEGQHYPMAEPTCSSPSSSTGIRPSRRSGRAAETRRADSQAKALSPHTAHRRIPVAKARVATLAYDSAPYRNRPVYGNFWRKSSHMTIPYYWNPQQVERLLASLAALGLRRARVAALIMWRSGLRVGETVVLEWRDIDLTAGTLLVRRGKGGRAGPFRFTRTWPACSPTGPRPMARATSLSR